MKNNNLLSSTENRVAGALLMALCALALFAMLHHPVINAHTPAEQAIEVVQEGGLNRAVHGSLILIIWLFYTLLYSYFAQLPGGLLTQRLAQSCYLLGVVTMSFAAIFSGFISPAWIATQASLDPDTFKGFRVLFWASNQSTAKIGTLGMLLGMVLWSLPLLRLRAWQKLTGLFGLIAGLGLSLAVSFDVFELQVRGMTWTLVAMLAWKASIGWGYWQLAAVASAQSKQH